MIDCVGDGPAELRGSRIGPRFMSARQAIYMRGGGRMLVDTGARLQFKFAHQQRYWWKFYNAARFELWRVGAEGRRIRRVRTGPKVAYCLRDLTPHPRLAAPLAAPLRLPGVQQRPGRTAGHARHLGRLGGHLPARPTPSSGST